MSASTTGTAKPLDDNYFQGSHLRTNWATHDPKMPQAEKDAGIENMKAKNIALWPRSYAGVKVLGEALNTVKGTPAFVAGDADVIYKTVLEDMVKQGYDITPYLRAPGAPAAAAPGVITRAEVLGSELVLKDNKLRPVVDKAQFKQQVTKLLLGVNRLEILKSVAKSSSEQDFWGLVVDMLEVDESYQLVGLLAARLLLPREQRDALDMQLTGVTVLLNRQGKLSLGVVRVGGFLGLACVKGVPELAQAVKFIKNPILGEDVENRPVVKRPGETSDQLAERKTNHETQFANYKAIMTEMKRYKPLFEAMEDRVKEHIRQEVLKFTVSG